VAMGGGQPGEADDRPSRRVSVQRVATYTLGLGVLIVMVAVYWSLHTYGSAGTAVIGKGLRPPALIHCLYGFGSKCTLMDDMARAKGAIPYTPVLFWVGIAIYIGSLVLNYQRGGRTVEDRSGTARMQRLLIPVDRISTFVGKLFAWTIVLLTLAISYEVFSRYAFGRPTSWAFDASYILYGALFIMAGAYALSRNGHVRGDFLYRTWPPRVQAGMDLILYFVAFFPGILAFIYSGYAFAAQSFVTNEHSAYSPAGPPIYHYKMLIPMTGILLLLQGTVEVIRCIACLRAGAWPQRLNDVEELEKVLQEQRLEKAGDHT
jgi:TRAP-type mannitol/chloroaromatic compound transport system permease small subunit